MAAAVGIEVTDACLPTTIWCPQCRTLSLLVIECTTNGIAAECRSCDFEGDIIDIACALWKCSRSEACQRLSPQLPVTPSVKKTPNTIEGLWRKARQNLETATLPDDVNACIVALAYNKPVDDYCETYGWIDAASVYAVLHRPLRMPKAKNYVVVPAWATTTRITGIYLIAIHAGELVRDYIPCSREEPDHGLTGLESALAAGSTTVIALYEPLLPDRVSKIQYRYTEQTAPIVGWYWDDQCRTTLAWQSLAGKEIVFFGSTLTWYMVCMAAMVDGRICLKGPEDMSYRSLSEYARRRDPAIWMHFATTRSRSWQAAMNLWVPHYSHTEEVMAMIQHMLANNFDPQIIAGQLNERARAKWENCMAGCEKLNRTQSAWLTNPKLKILRTRSGWYAQQGSEVWTVLNADLQIDAMFLRGGEAWYRGKIVCRTMTYPFEGRAAEIEGDCWLWLRNLSALYGINLEFAARQRSRLFEIATLFKKPAIVAEASIPAFDPTPIKRSKHDWRVHSETPDTSSSAAQPRPISPICEDQGGEDGSSEPEASGD